MTRKDYILISQALFRAHRDNRQVSDEAIETVAKELAYALKSDNGAFDKERFIRACQTGSK